MSVWAYSSTFNAQYLYVLKKPVNTQWQLFSDPTTGVAVHGGGSDAGCQSQVFPAGNKWHMITATISGTACLIYVDGALVFTGTVTAIGNGTTAGTNDVLISTYDGTNYPFNGRMDEVRVYNRALSADEVKRLYNLGR